MTPDVVGANGAVDDQIIAALAHERRGAVLDVLNDAGTSLPLPDLARGVARREGVSGPLGDGEFRRVRLSLYHRHVPKLVDAGLVEYHGDRKTVRLAEPLDLPTPGPATAASSGE